MMTAYVLLGLVTLAAVILTLIFIVPERRSYSLSPFMRKIRDFLMMKRFYLEGILRVMYIIFSVATPILCIGASFLTPLVTIGRYDMGRALGGALGGLLGGAVASAVMLFVLRIIFENAMMMVSLTNAAKSLDSKYNGSSASHEEPSGRYNYQPQAYQQPAYQEPAYTQSPYTAAPQQHPQQYAPQNVHPQQQRPQQQRPQNPQDGPTVRPQHRPQQQQQPLKYAVCRKCGARFDPRWGQCPICKERM